MKLLPLIAIPLGFMCVFYGLRGESILLKGGAGHRSRTRCNCRRRIPIDRMRVGFRVSCVPIGFKIVGEQSQLHSQPLEQAALRDVYRASFSLALTRRARLDGDRRASDSKEINSRWAV